MGRNQHLSSPPLPPLWGALFEIHVTALSTYKIQQIQQHVKVAADKDREAG